MSEGTVIDDQVVEKRGKLITGAEVIGIYTVFTYFTYQRQLLSEGKVITGGRWAIQVSAQKKAIHLGGH